MDIKKAHDEIVEFINEKIKNANSNGVIIGLSGGIDSALVAYLAVEALGNKKVLGIHLPDFSLKSNKDTLDATKIAQILNIEFKVIDIENIINSYINHLPDGNQATQYVKGNLKARTRMTILYYYANLLNRLVIGTSNKTELLLGYFTKYGDGGSDMLPIGDLFKTEVWEMSSFLNLPLSIINKEPSAGLWEGQTDEKDLGVTYKKLDEFIMLILEKENIDMAIDTLGINRQQAKSILNRIEINSHKIKTPPMPMLRDLRNSSTRK